MWRRRYAGCAGCFSFASSNSSHTSRCVPVRHVVAHARVVERPLPPVEQRLRPLQRRLHARILCRARLVIVVAERQQVEIEVRGVHDEVAAAAIEGAAGELLLLRQHVTELGPAFRRTLRRQPETVHEEKRLERALIRAADVPQRARVVLVQERGRHRRQAGDALAERAVLQTRGTADRAAARSVSLRCRDRNT